MIDFQEILVDQVTAAHATRVSERGHRLFHYTDVNKFESIYESDSIWFGALTDMNDPMEISYGIKFIEYIFEEFIVASEDRHARRFTKLMLDQLEHFENYYSSVFVFCLTANEPNLLHWRLYGDDGCGVALEFEKQHLLQLSAQNRDHTFFLTPVIYDQNDRKAIGNAISEHFQSVVGSDTWKSQMESASEDNLAQIAQSSLTTLGLLPLILKSNNYRIESEWRIVVLPTRKQRQTLQSPDDSGREYYPVPLELLVPRPNKLKSPTLGQIHLGPWLSLEENKAMFVRKMRQASDRHPNKILNNKYKKSDLKYRPKNPTSL
ncbi:MAG: DUF2971 domain-containing protein [Planctomycetota bacterium]